MKNDSNTSLQPSINLLQTILQELLLIVRPTALVAFLMLGSLAFAQADDPFTVKNQKNKEWPAAEANRIYASACMLVAREIRPERPPELRPRFTLVLGAEKDQVLQRNQEIEIQLKSWNREKFAQAIVILAAREVVQNQNVVQLTKRTLSWTDAVVPAADLADAH